MMVRAPRAVDLVANSAAPPSLVIQVVTKGAKNGRKSKAAGF